MSVCERLRIADETILNRMIKNQERERERKRLNANSVLSIQWRDDEITFN